MRILQILPELHVGGVERGTLDLSVCLIKEGHESFVVSNGGGLVEQLQSHGAIHYTLPVHQKNIFTIIHCVRALKKILEKERIDIVHARSRVPALIAWLATRNTDIQFITTCHGYYSNNVFSKIMGWGKRVIVVSDVIGRHMVEDFGVRRENIRLIPRSVDLDKFLFRPRKKGNPDFTVIMIGRMTSIKGYEFFLRAMAKVLRQKSFVRVRIVGDAPANKKAYKESLMVLVKHLGIEDKVEFLGNRADIPSLLSEANALVLPTITQEAFGRVLVEAQAVGVPVIATKVGGIVDIVEHEKTGLLVLPKDADAIASAVLRLMQEPKLVDEMILEARKRVEEKYTLEQMVKKTIEVYEEVLTSTAILVIHLGSIKEMIQTTIVLKALRNRYPKANIVFLTSREALSLLQGCPYIDEVLIYPKGFLLQWPFNMRRLLLKLRHYRFDKAIDLQNNMWTHLLAWGSLPRFSYGYRTSKMSFLLTHGIEEPKESMSFVEKQFLMLKPLGLLYDKDLRLEFWPRREDEKYIKGLLNEAWINEKTHIIVGLSIDDINASLKMWEPSVIAKVCDLLSADGIRVVITGREQCGSLMKAILAQVKSKPAVFVGKTNVFQLAALMKFLKAYITPVSLSMYIACAMKTPLIAVCDNASCINQMPPCDRMEMITNMTSKEIYESVTRVFIENQNHS